MEKDNLLDITDEVMRSNMLRLIEDEDTNISGAGFIGITVVGGGLIKGIADVFGITSACTSRCNRR